MLASWFSFNSLNCPIYFCNTNTDTHIHTYLHKRIFNCMKLMWKMGEERNNNNYRSTESWLSRAILIETRSLRSVLTLLEHLSTFLGRIDSLYDTYSHMKFFFLQWTLLLVVILSTGSAIHSIEFNYQYLNANFHVFWIVIFLLSWYFTNQLWTY